MANDKFSVKEALNFGWETFKNHAGFLIGFVVVMFAITIIPDLVVSKLFDQGSIALALSRLLIRLVELFVGMVGIRIALDLHDKDVAVVPALGDLLALYPKYLVGKILYVIIVMLGTLLLIVPGMIAAYMFLYVGFLTVDRGLGPIEGLKESKVLTTGYKWDLFLFSALLTLINIVGFFVIFIGLFATIPTTLLASAYVYRRLSPATTPTV